MEFQEKTEKKTVKIHFDKFEYIITDLIILSEIVTSIFIISKYHSNDFDGYDDKSKQFIQTLIELLYLFLKGNFDDLKTKVKKWNEDLKSSLKTFEETSDAVKDIVNFINLINEYLEKEQIWELLIFISKKIDDLKNELNKKKKANFLIKLLKILKMGLKKILI